MNSIDSVINQIATDASEGELSGSVESRIGELSMAMMSNYVTSEVENRARRLHFLDSSNPLLEFYFVPKGDYDDKGVLVPEKVAARMDNFVNIYWDWTLGDWHDNSESVVMTSVWGNYLDAFSKFALHSFLPRDTEMHMEIERQMMKYGRGRSGCGCLDHHGPLVDD